MAGNWALTYPCGDRHHSLPEGELGRIRKTGRGGAVYDLMESLRGMGVRLDQLCGMGVLVWGFFDSNCVS